MNPIGPSPISHFNETTTNTDDVSSLAYTPDLETYKKIAVFGTAIVTGALFSPLVGVVAQEALTVYITGNSDLINSACLLMAGLWGQALPALMMFGATWALGETLRPVIKSLAKTPAIRNIEKTVARTAIPPGRHIAFFDDDPVATLFTPVQLKHFFQQHGQELQIASPQSAAEDINALIAGDNPVLWLFKNVEEGREVMAKIPKNKLQLVICNDVMGEGMDGISYLEKLAITHPNTKKIFYSVNPPETPPNWGDTSHVDKIDFRKIITILQDSFRKN